MELIVLNIGLDLGVISPKLFTMLVLMALFTTFITTPLVKRIYPPELMARELPAVAEQAPLPAQPGFTVLVCVANERSGPPMIALAGALYDRDERAQLYALELVPATDRQSFYVQPKSEEASAETLRPLLDRARELDLSVESLSFVSADPAEDICKVARARGANLILMGWHKPVLGGAVLGGTVSSVMKEATTDVGVLIDRGLVALKRVLVPFSNTAHDIAALKLARRLVPRVESVTVLHVVSPERRLAEGTLGARDEVERTFYEEGGRVVFRVVEHESPEDAVLSESRAGYDLIVIGAGRDWGLEQRPFALQRERLIAECSVSMLVVHNSTAEAPATARVTAEAHDRSAPSLTS